MNVDPEQVLQEILATNPRPQKVRNLHAIHAVCRAHHEAKARDFSLPAIGKICEEKKIIAGKGLYNSSAADYRRLIEAWAMQGGPILPRPEKVLASDEYVNRIDDPAVRMLVQSVIAERNRLRAQLNTLKSATTIVVDRRPVEGAPPLPSLSGFTSSERLALEKAVSAKFLQSQGWEETKLGEIVNERGRTIFDPGFATAIRKVLGQSSV